jgi:hypothetical protein
MMGPSWPDLTKAIASLKCCWLRCHHLARGFGGTDHGFGFANGVGYWFFHVHVFARRKGIGQLQAMPMVGCGHQYRVEVFVFEHLAVVFVHRQVGYSGFGQVVFALGQLGVIYITNGHDIDVVDFQKSPDVVEALVFDSNEANVDFVAGGYRFSHGYDGLKGQKLHEPEAAEGGSGIFDKSPACFHDVG